jgi:hypothetical protein
MLGTCLKADRQQVHALARAGPEDGGAESAGPAQAQHGCQSLGMEHTHAEVEGRGWWVVGGQCPGTHVSKTAVKAASRFPNPLVWRAHHTTH